ncbi:chemotaxis protein CheA [Ideonella sp.]|jgi:two-component system chemotaxis sensor kinase CheA|uniref:chemotaxis protein CheA n=1 Tax=Ideonella sp. TaxID=1929293 RepID=UPI0037C0510B
MMHDDEEILAIARAGFLDEASDMLRQFEQALLIMEENPTDAENLNAAFRAAHTIKGTAGLFGFDAVVHFTHEAETLLECLRSGQLAVNEHLTALLLRSRDQMEALLEEVRSGESDPEVAAVSVSLGAELRAAMSRTASTASAAATSPAAAAAAAAPAPAELPQGSGYWHISLRFGLDALRNGLDPLAFIRYLDSLGTVQHMHLLQEAIPALEGIDPENCYVGVEVAFDSTASQQAIEQVFDFCHDDCDVVVLAPNADAATRQALLTRRTEAPEAREALAALWDDMGLAAPAVDMDLLPEPELESPAESADAVATETTASAPKADSAVAAPITAAAPSGKAAPKERKSEESRFIRVRADKLDRLIDLIGELVIASSGAQLVAHTEQSPSFMEAAQRISDIVEEARDGALGLRMVPIGDTFARFHRVVRDLSKQLGKDIELVITGGDTELDKSMVETIADPLMHLVRNSLDHGIEPTEQRIAVGKSAQGRLAFNAYHESGSIVIEVSDDGKGLDRDRILKKAIERNLVPHDAALDDEAIYQLIFLPGFSTAEAVTNVSGRGVGMDVVKRNIESLRGHIRVASQPGRGATMQIRLPLTLAMIDGFLTMVGDVHYVLPLSVVSECIDVPQECLADPARTCGTFDLRGEVLPYLDLARFYGVEPGLARRRSLIVVRDGAVRIGLVVDRLLGEHQTVIKPLAGIFRHIKALAGSTILGSGAVALVLDMQGVLQAATRQDARLAPSSGAFSQRIGSDDKVAA